MFANAPNMASASMNQANAYAQTAAYQGKIDAPNPKRELDATIHRITQQVEQLLSYSQRLSAIADRIVGSRPQAVGQAGAASTQSHMPLSGKLSLLSDVLGRLANETSESLDRLENFI